MARSCANASRKTSRRHAASEAPRDLELRGLGVRAHRDPHRLRDHHGHPGDEERGADARLAKPWAPSALAAILGDRLGPGRVIRDHTPLTAAG